MLAGICLDPCNRALQLEGLVTEQVIEIHPDAKYVVIIDPEEHDLEDVARNLGDWWGNENDPFMIMPNTMKLVRVDKDKE